MATEIVPYREEHIPAVAAFNERARTNRAPFLLSKTPQAAWLPNFPGRSVYREFFLAIADGEVRGGFTLRRQTFWLKGTEVSGANYQGPLSEGLWDRRHMMVGVQMLRAAMRDEPRMYALGMGGPEQPLPKLLKSAGWSMLPVPFFFRVLRPTRFLRQIRALRKSEKRARLLDFAASTGTGEIALRLLHWWRSAKRPAGRMSATFVTEFGPWADEIWAAARDTYTFSAVRNREIQNTLFGDGGKNLILHCTRAGRDSGWAVVRSTPMQGDKYFGDLRVGSIVDAMALPGEERAVAWLARRELRKLQSDLIVTNQSHAAWTAAFRDDGYLAGPSNFLIACSPKLIEELGPLDQALGGLHFTRADGDGPIHL